MESFVLILLVNQTNQTNQTNQSEQIDVEQRQDINLSNLENRIMELLKEYSEVTTKEIVKNWRLRIIR